MKERTKKLIAILLMLVVGMICIYIFGKRLYFSVDERISTSVLITSMSGAMIGIVLILLSICMLISAVINKSFGKITFIVGVIFAVLILFTGINLGKKIKSVLSVKKVCGGLYSMEYAGNVKTDELLKTDIRSLPEMVKWIRKAEFYNLPFTIDEKNIGCAAYIAKTPEGKVIMGRNFDYDETDTLMVHITLKDGYESYAMADLRILGVGSNGNLLHPESMLGKAVMLVEPYGVTDGFNEAGLGAAILELPIGETHMNTDKHDLFIYCAVRALLDKCATVDEALTLLENQDIHTWNGVSYHLFVADKTGRSVVVEWLDERMHVNELNAATNSVLTEGAYFDQGSPDGRYKILHDTLEEHGEVLTMDDAKNLLKVTSQSNTEWSCIYNLSDFNFDVFMDINFDEKIHFPR